MSRARPVSAVAFGLAAAVVAGALLLSSDDSGGAWWAWLGYLLAFAGAGAAVGAGAGPRLAGCRTAWGAVGIGLAVTVASALLFVSVGTLVSGVAGLFVQSPLSGLGVGDLGWLVLYAALSGVVVSPVGMLAGWLAWRRLRGRRRRRRRDVSE